MSKAIDAMRAYFNQTPLPKVRFLLDTRNKINEMIDVIESENTKLSKENDELRIDVDLMTCQLRARAEERDDLKAENAKLRELCGDMRREKIVRCKDCKHASMSINGEYAKYCKVLTTLDELGYPESEPQFDADFYCAWGEEIKED